MSQQATLLDQILSGQNRKLQVLAAAGLVPLPLEQLVPLQVGLAQSPDPEVAGKAVESLEKLDPRLADDFLSHTATEPVLRYFATKVDSPLLLLSIIRRSNAPRSVLLAMASRIPPELQEPLVLRQDAILDEPGILVALERNPRLSAYARRRIWEYREHLLPREKVPPKKESEILEEADNLSEEEIEEAIAEVKEEGAEGRVEETSGLTEGQIRSLPLPVRIRLARAASRQMRSILIRDQNAQVALTVLHASQLTEQEVEQVANSRSVLRDVLTEISRKREWMRKYSVIKALARNPRTDLPLALRLVPRLVVRDLRDLGRDKNVPSAVRATAFRLYQSKR